MLEASVSGRSYECWSVDSQGFSLLVSSMASGSYTLSISSSKEFPELKEEEFDGEIPFTDVFQCLSISVFCLYAFPSAEKEASLIKAE